MIPVRDTIPCHSRPVITWALIGINSFIFIALLPLSGGEVQNIFIHYGLVPARFFHPRWALYVIGLNPNDYSGLITSLFLHANWMHLIMNMWMMWIFADNVEDRMGRWRFVIFYLLCGLVSGAAHLFFNSNSPLPMVGASGAIAGVMGAYFFLFPYARLVVWIPILFLPIFIEVPAIAFLGVWVLFQLFNATHIGDAEQAYTGVAWWGHLGGFFAGIVLFRFFLRPKGVR